MNPHHKQAMAKDSKVAHMTRPNIDPDKAELDKLSNKLATQKAYVDNPLDLISEGGPIKELPGPFVVLAAPAIDMTMLSVKNTKIIKTREQIEADAGEALRFPQTIVGVGSDAAEKFAFGDKVLLKNGAQTESVFYYNNIQFMVIGMHDIMFKVNPDKIDRYDHSYREDFAKVIEGRKHFRESKIPTTAQ